MIIEEESQTSNEDLISDLVDSIDRLSEIMSNQLQPKVEVTVPPSNLSPVFNVAPPEITVAAPEITIPAPQVIINQAKSWVFKITRDKDDLIKTIRADAI